MHIKNLLLKMIKFKTIIILLSKIIPINLLQFKINQIIKVSQTKIIIKHLMYKILKLKMGLDMDHHKIIIKLHHKIFLMKRIVMDKKYTIKICIEL